MAALPAEEHPPIVPLDDYLRLDREAVDRRYEYLDGVVVAMSGASVRHATIVANLLVGLRGSLRARGCDLVAGDLRVGAAALGSYTYPDLVAFCGTPELEPGREVDTLLDPVLLIEVLSPSTEAYDRRDKLFAYQRIPSLREYLLVTQERARVELYRRDAEPAPDAASEATSEATSDGERAARWIYRAAEGLDASLSLATVQTSLALATIYDGVALDAPPQAGPMALADESPRRSGADA